jgi:hypothetical protein
VRLVSLYDFFVRLVSLYDFIIMCRKFSLLCFNYFVFTICAYAQTGKDWIIPSQQYYKIEVGENHIYTISYDNLVAAGIPVVSIDAKNIQLFKNGEEQYIYVRGQDDNRIGLNDFIEFYGEKNNGELDEPLYMTPAQQPHKYMSLFQDTTNYYLTWSATTSGKRLTDYNDGNYSGKTSDDWLWHTSVTYFSNGASEEFYDGSPYYSPGTFSEYSEGEGWFGPYIAGSITRVTNVNTEEYNNNGPDPQLSFSVYGKSNPDQFVDGENHRIEVLVGSTFLYGKNHAGYTRIESDLNAPVLTIPSNLVGATTPVSFRSTYLARGRHAVSYIKIDYPRNLDLSEKDYFEVDYSASNDFFAFSNFDGNSAIIFDLTNNRRISGDVSGSVLRFNTSTRGAKKLRIVDESKRRAIPASSISEINFDNSDYSTTNYDYIIVTHPKLSESALEYKAYRESSIGGGFNVLIAYMPDIYEKYYYGLKHPIALKNFCKDVYTSQTNKPKHVLLLGKGQSYFLTRFNYSRRELENLVPTWGEPGSDYPFVTDYTPNNLAPVMAIGRIPSRTNEDVQKYLYKLKLHEQYLTRSKKVLFLTGGVGQAEQQTLESKQNLFYNTIKTEKFGAEGMFINKRESTEIDKSLVQNIQSSINEGVHTLSYFGHGASQVLELDIGKPNQLDNEGRYPLFVFNGCALGNTFSDISLPEEFLFEEKKGGVAWIASSAYGFIGPLSNWTTLFYQNLYNSNYGKSVGEVIANTIKDYQNPSDNLNRSQCRQMTYHGDPALKLYAPDRPDYQIDMTGTTSNEALLPSNANAELDSFAIKLDLKNFGKVGSKAPLVHVSMKYSNDSVRNFGPRSFGPVYSTSSVLFWLPINEFSAGIQTATITIDYGDSIEELSPAGETNNILDFTFSLPSNRLSILYPKKDGIQPFSDVTLKVQNNNLLAKNNAVIFQIDTTPLFNSPVLQVSNEIIADNIVEHTFILPPFDSTDFFWRAVFAADFNDPTKYVQSSFSLIFNSPNGWSQGYLSKLAEATTKTVGIDTIKNKLAFKRTLSGRYDMYPGGIKTTWFKINIIADNRKTQGRYARNQVEMMAVNPDNLDRYSEENNIYNLTNRSRDYIPGFKYYETGKKSGVYFFDPKISVQRDSMYNLLGRIPQGWHLFFLINGDVDIETWSDSLFSALEQFGAAKIRTINHGDPYGLMGLKGDGIGEAIELVANYQSSLDPHEQLVPGSKQFSPLLTSGDLTTKNVGPSKNWKQFYRIQGDSRDTDADTVAYSILGVRPNQTDTLLVPPTNAKTVDLSLIDASSYPNLKVRAHYKDEDRRTPASHKRWTVLYDGVPEGSLMPDIVFEQSHDTIQQGDSIGFAIAYKNISSYDMDSILVHAVNLRSDNTSDTIEMKRYAPLASGDSIILAYKLGTLNLIGKNNFIISVNPKFDQPEEQLENNVISLSYVVEKDEKNPILDVVFDGAHILDFDIVSSVPVITMSVLDDNRFLFISDPEAFTATISYLDYSENPTGEIDSILSTMTGATFYPATGPGDKAILEYIPEGLESGKYRLDVAVSDVSGNSSSDLAYSINFEVIKESQITNVYPYPNPFTTSMKFVYTITGDIVPDYMKIQILTVTGKVVREITLAEIGPIRIGNNISEFTWNGTDEFGDQLANGVYLYKVTAKINGEDIQQRESAGDKFFHNGYGKIYLMR